MDPQRSAARARELFEVYTKDLTASDLQRLFTRDTREAYAFFSRGVDRTEIDRLPWYRRLLVDVKLFFLAFTMRLSPARRAIFAVAFIASLIGFFNLSIALGNNGDRQGLVLLLAGFCLINLLIVLEVADRLSLKHDLNVARDIQLAMFTGRRSRPTRSAATSTTCCRCRTGGCWWRWGTWRGKAVRRRC